VASGTRAVAAADISGNVATGDGARIDARVDARSPALGAGSIPRPADAVVAAGMNNLPRPPATAFVGREWALDRLEAGLAGSGSIVVTQAVYGLGGVGKSELALQYAHAHRLSCPLTWWITAEDSSRIEAGLASLAGRIAPELALAATTQEAAEWALTWLQAHPGWLLILDNVSDPEDVGPLLGQLHGGRILLTTRRDAGWQRFAAPVRLDVLDPAPAADLLTAATGHTSPEDARAAAGIAADLGYLPLALDQAAAYINQARITQARYLELLRAQPAQMHAAVAAGGQAQRTIARLWDITLEAISRDAPAAVRLLRTLACYAPDNIPRRIIGGDDSASHDAALGLLASYSMITLTPGTVTMHRLVQAVILAAPGSGDGDGDGEEPPRDTALRWLDDALPGNPDTNVAGWPLLRALVPHADSLANRYAPEEEPVVFARVLNQMGLFHQAQGAYQDALRLRTAALDIVRTHDESDAVIATCLGNLAFTYSDLGRSGDALPLEERALAISEAVLGPDHPDTALRLGNLAATYDDLGRSGDALPLKERALAIAEAVLGPDHPDTALRLGNLAFTYKELGRAGDALPLEERALAISEAVLGPDHPDTAGRLGNLACTYRDLGRPGDALPLEERALVITEAILGPDHPRTALRLGNLAATYGDLGWPGDALPLAERALAITEMVLGPDHPDTALRLGNLARTYSALGRPRDALPFEERALMISEAVLGPDHPDTARCLGNLACTYRELGRPGDALPLAERALSIAEAALGPHHRDTALRLGNLAVTYSDLGRPGDALRLEERALSIAEAVLGPDHPDTARCLGNLACTYRELGRPGDALPLEERALRIGWDSGASTPGD